MTPRGNLVLVRELGSESQILLPDSARDGLRNSEVEVVAVGPGAFNVMTGTYKPIEATPGVPLVPGDRVVINLQMAFVPGTDWNEQRMALIPESEIWAVVKP